MNFFFFGRKIYSRAGAVISKRIQYIYNPPGHLVNYKKCKCFEEYIRIWLFQKYPKRLPYPSIIRASNVVSPASLGLKKKKNI